MANVSLYEREQIELLTCPTPVPPIEPGSGLAIFDAADNAGRFLYDAAIAPAFRSAGLNLPAVELAFSDESSLATVTRSIQSAEVIIADVSIPNPSIFYCLGFAHALGRCPILLTCGYDEVLPFNLRSLRCIRYGRSKSQMVQLREELGRALRVFRDAAQ